jgi:hypothetical protein
MAQEDRPPIRSSSSHLARRPRLQQILAHAWSEWRVELFITLLVAVAVFLLVEWMQIRQTVLDWLRQGLHALRNFGGGMLRGLVDFIQSTTLSDLTGYALLLAAGLCRLAGTLATDDHNPFHRAPVSSLLRGSTAHPPAPARPPGERVRRGRALPVP